jgi:ubiquinone/menaquinone biosynthesis C-methylase UbiE
MNNNITIRSYEAHDRYRQENFLKEDNEDHFFLLKNKDCVWYKMTIRNLEIFKPLFKEKNKWLTIGDYNGFEAKYLSEQNQDATASDISDVYLKASHNHQLIDKYAKINVECIEYAENDFDYVFCKESFHHFPRAYLGLYEMIRVAKKGLILVEPVDALEKMPWLLLLKNICDCFHPYLINKIWKNRFSWETIGNYVFKISDREIEKIAMGMGLPCIAFKEVNTILKSLPAKWGDIQKAPLDERLYNKVKRKYAIWDFICKWRIIPYNTFCAIIFKEKPSQKLLDDLRSNNYRVIELPPNPYIVQQ